MLQRLFFASAAVALVSFTVTGFTSCGTGTGGGSGGGGGSDPELVCDASPTATAFSKVYSDVMSTNCLQGCHVATATDGSDSYGLYNTEMAAFAMVGKTSLYAGAEKTLKIVEANKLDNSSMYLKVLARTKSPGGKNLGGAMPLGKTALTAAQKKLIKDWICLGAKP